jgi:hypothetical protein
VIRNPVNHIGIKSVIPGQAEGLSPEPTIKHDARHPVVGSGFGRSVRPGMTVTEPIGFALMRGTRKRSEGTP